MRAWPIVGGAVVLAGAAGIASLGVLNPSDDDVAGADGTTTTERNTVEVVERDLVRTESFDGTAGHGATTPLLLVGSGTLTALPETGTIIEAGDVVAEIDGAPVIALAGAFPMWRTLGASVADGKDVLQLEYVLASLGYTDDGDLTVDDDWTSATTRSVKDFQTDHGQDDDGTVDLGEIAWIDGPVRVDSVGGTVGQSPAEAAIEVTTPQQSVRVDVAVADADLLALGTELDVELPSGEVVTGTVTDVGVVQTGENGDSTLPVELALAAAEPLPDGTPVEVTAQVVSAEGVLAVPVEAVLALAEGGYAVEGVLADGTTRLVGVELGVFADGDVEIRGEIGAGDQVVTP